ncbi:hypothetical protein GGI19_000576 [Coemansia pectinata]|uniref:Glutathione S-transferase kappa n=1 Tax=Coemansia pectinata TaxID=1052879 RepID=A0A9W8H5Y8_9FUNG|nr:hypothetical protein GGI19_000576 [Coemansia pectinata]
MADARIVFYFDCASAFSYIGFEFMEKYKALWNIDVDYRPFVLEEVMANAKNAFSPYKLPYLFQDLKRTSSITGIPFNGVPAQYPYDPIVALRTLQFIKIHNAEKMPQAMRKLWHMEYVQRKAPGSIDDVKQALKGVVDEAVVDQAMAASETLEAVKTNIAHIKELKGFGAPTILAYKAGSAKPQLFFGSDRFEHLAMYLDREFYPMKQLFANAKI